MGKIRLKVVGDEALEQKQKEKAKQVIICAPHLYSTETEEIVSPTSSFITTSIPFVTIPKFVY